MTEEPYDEELTIDEKIDQLVEEGVEAIEPEGVEVELVEEPGEVQFVFVPGKGMMFLAPGEDADWQPIEDCPADLRNEYAIMQAMNRRLMGDGAL